MKSNRIKHLFVGICFLLLMYSCNNNSENILFPDILSSLTPLTKHNDDIVYELYQKEIFEWISLDTAYEVYYGRFDLDGDSIDEIIAYAISSVNSGSLGNIQLDIWKKEGDDYVNIGVEEALLLNSHEPAFEGVKVDILTKCQNNYCLIRITSEYSNGEKVQIAAYFGNRYQLEDRN